MSDPSDFLSSFPLVIALMTFALGYLLGERQERRRISDTADDVRETMALIRERLDRKQVISPDDDQPR